MLRLSLKIRLLATHLSVLAIGTLLLSVGAHQWQQVWEQQALAETVGEVAQTVPKKTWHTEPDLFLAAGASLSLVLILSTQLNQAIAAPLLRMQKALRQIVGGDLSARVPGSNIPELQELSVSINSMAQTLQGIEERRREQMSNFAHEFRTPLTTILGYLELVHDGTEMSSDLQQQVEREAQRMKRLIDDLRELSAVEAGVLPLQLQPVSPHEVLKESVQLIRGRTRPGVALKVRCPHHLPLVLADHDRFQQIVINLISNAIKYTLAGKILVRAWVAAPYVWIAVQDTGIGIASEELPHVFDRFWRSDRARAVRSSGSGIGLAVTKRLVELQGGKIEVESQLEQGSLFRVALPIAQ